MKNLNEKSYDTVLTEANDFFMAQGCSIIGEGYKEIASNASLFESYVDQLTEGCSADDAAVLAQLMANTNAGILRESSMTGIQPIASLSMPVIRKLWPKFALKEAIATEVAKSPRFVVSYTKPYMVGADGEKVYIPKALTGYAGKGMVDGVIPDELKKSYSSEHTVTLAAGSATTVDFGTTQAGGVDGKVVIADSKTPSGIKRQPCDELIIKSAKLGFVAAHDDVAEVPGTEIKIGKRLGITGSGVYEVSEGEGASLKKGQLIVQFAGAEGKATFALVGDAGLSAATLVVCAGVSSEYNEESYSVGFDIARQDVDIPTGQHINAPLPIEALNDMMALYQIDGTKETVDLMTNIFAQKLDVEILDFLRDSLAGQPRNEAFFGLPGASEYVLSFDCRPAAGFAGSPKAWREEIKPLIDHLAQKIKNATYLQGGSFSIVCNPLDAQILANVDWSFRGGVGGNVDGVAVDYSVGTYVGANAYKVIASVNVPQGAMYVVFTPSGNTQMTYKYYPYTFSTEMGYVDPNRSRVPSIMMTKRHTFHEFMPAIGCILVANNDGSWFNAWHDSSAVKYAE
jgi:hypothetical protein